MAKNKRKDLAVKAAKSVGILLMLLAAVGGFLISYIENVNFKIEKPSTSYISSADELIELGVSSYNNEIILTGDIRIEQADFRIGSESFPFCGVFNGNGHTVTLAYAAADSNTSLFGYMSPEAVLKNTGFELGQVRVNDSSYGGVVKINDGTITDCKLTFSDLEITQAGLFSPFVTINRGQISNVVIQGSVSGDVAAGEEAEVFYGSVCVYNYGTLKSVISSVEFSGLECTKEINILKGLTKNYGISAVRYLDSKDAVADSLIAVITEGCFTCDKNSAVEFAFNRADVFTYAKIFDSLDFNNRYWQLSGNDLVLKPEVA